MQKRVEKRGKSMIDDLDKTLTGLAEKYLRAHNLESHLQDQLDSHVVLAVDIRLALRSAYLHGFQAAGGLLAQDPETVFRDPLKDLKEEKPKPKWYLPGGSFPGEGRK
jgi:hypothetical protein